MVYVNGYVHLTLNIPQSYTKTVDIFPPHDFINIIFENALTTIKLKYCYLHYSFGGGSRNIEFIITKFTKIKFIGPKIHIIIAVYQI